MPNTFLNVLNDTAVVFIRDLSDYNWEARDGEIVATAATESPAFSGWEAYSPFGEIRAFATREEAHAWRVTEVLYYIECTEGAN